MKTPVEKQQEDFFKNVLESIKPNNLQLIERRIHHIGFARIISWLCITSKDKNTFISNDLRSFLRIDNSSVHRALKEISETGMINKKYNSDGSVYYVFAKDDKGLPKIRTYFSQALKTLGMKPKKEITFKLEQEMEDEDSYF